MLELSIQDKGGRKNWNEYSLASSSGAGGSGSQVSTQSSTAPQPAVSSSSASSAAAAAAAAAVARQQAHSTGYVPSTETQPQTYTQTQTTAHVAAVESSPEITAAVPSSPTPSSTEAYTVTRVRALHSFEPTELNELAFEKGDIIKVVNREYKDWWRGQIRGRTGIFPVNYVVRYAQPPTLPLAVLTSRFLVVFRNLFRNPPQPNWQPRRSRKLPCSRRRLTSIACCRCSALWTPLRIILPTMRRSKNCTAHA